MFELAKRPVEVTWGFLKRLELTGALELASGSESDIYIPAKRYGAHIRVKMMRIK